MSNVKQPVPQIWNIADIKAPVEGFTLLHFTSAQWASLLESVELVIGASDGEHDAEFYPVPGKKADVLMGFPIFGECGAGCLPTIDLTPDGSIILPKCSCPETGGGKLPTRCHVAIKKIHSGGLLNVDSFKLICVDSDGRECRDEHVTLVLSTTGPHIACKRSTPVDIPNPDAH